MPFKGKGKGRQDKDKAQPQGSRRGKYRGLQITELRENGRENGREKRRIVAVVGPTASGKSDFALRLATEISGAVIGADSLQVYKHFDIGSAKPSPEAMSAAPHFMIDIARPDEDFNAGTYRSQAAAAVEKLCAQKVPPIVAGGTFLYVRALLGGLIENPADPQMRRAIETEEKKYGTRWLHETLSDADPAAAEQIHPSDSVRLRRALEIFYSAGKKPSEIRRAHGFSEQRFDCLKIGLAAGRPALAERINARTQKMFERGIIEETQKIRELGYGANLKPMSAIGYRQANLLIDGKITRRDAVETAARDTRRLAKRQMTWLRKEKDIKWFPLEKLGDAISECRKFLSAN